MPKDLAAGHSDNTPLKQDQFGMMLSVHMRIAQGRIAQGWPHPEYVYHDVNAGPGEVAGRAGSPLVFMRNAWALGIRARASFYDRDAETLERLRGVLRERYGSQDRIAWEIVQGNNADEAAGVRLRLLATVRRPAYGLIYVDPNGSRKEAESSLAAARVLLADGPLTRYVDVFAHLSATGYKREEKGALLLDDLRSLGKRYIWLRRPNTAWDWTMAILTNWDRFPEFRRHGYRLLGTPEGDDIADKLQLTRDGYRQRGQAQLPFAMSPPIGVTESTSDTPDSGLFVPWSWSGQVGDANGVNNDRRRSLTT